ncbi:hypothetical protein JJB07_16450 [Tumebacillus sp. ITR2]|uniref:Uncharacterized protein n=1 Tax=Tumebacillus amylolyticus TaxID=2801339 RepID=A0ABS1JDC2_9BACL|nr:hypothetical protein [Tumebacillus amylolyticus]MBL0388205.1 hypothetical protein [Tumebacillus amylolyticus]
MQAVYNKMIAIQVPDNSFTQPYSERTKAFMSHMFDMLDIRGSIFHEDGSPDVEKAKGLITLMDEFTADGEAYSQEFTSTAN